MSEQTNQQIKPVQPNEPAHVSPPPPNQRRKQLLTIVLVVIVLVASALIVTRLTSTTTNKPNEPSSSQPAAEAEVTISKTGFVPSTLKVKAGTKITWTSQDSGLHQIEANPYPTGKSLPKLKSEILNSGQTYVFTATQKGTFGYHDRINPTLNGTIEVE
jgi:plastocyanin